ncbi:MAG TPA: ABC transporter substrate-binding protein [Candidatus Gastranaerophilales bacterium]|nr:ABC transporter substrate-binding protein [Candidatus Gastranaerophilales bacterium]
MKIKKYIKYLIWTGIIFLILSNILHVDKPEMPETIKTQALSQNAEVKYPGDFKTIEINGREYIQARGEVGKYGGTLNNSTIGEGPKTFNPWNAKDATSSQMSELMFDGLVTTDAYTGQVIPLLAKSVEVDKTGTIYTVKLRKGLKWSDGKPINAEDVVFTWNKIIAGGFGNTSARDNTLIDGKMPEVKALDKLTVQFITPKPFAPFLRQLTQSIAPKHILEPVANKGKTAFDSFWGVTTEPDKFVTSGKFKLQRYIPAQRVEFIRNTDYYAIDKKGQKLPYLDKYIFYIVGDINNQVLKFESKQIDTLALSGSNVARFKELEKHSDYKIYNLGPDTSTMFLSFNLNKRKNTDGKYYVDPAKQRWFNDKNFRKAVNLAIDRENAVLNILRGVGSPLYTAESLSSVFLNENLKNGEPGNIDKAKNLLKQSGFTWNNKGKLLDNKGNIVEFNIITNAGNTEREALGVMIKEDLEKLGIKINFKPIEFNVLVGKLSDSLEWEAVIIGLTGSPLEPHSGRNVWSSTGALHLFNQRKKHDLQNATDLSEWEKELDEIFEKGALAIEFKERKKYYDRYQEIVWEYNPFIYIYSNLTIVAVRNNFGNITPTTLGGVLHNLEEIYVKE